MADTNPIMYIIVPNDIPSLNPGKAMAHTAHAGSKITHEFYNGDFNAEMRKLFNNWLEQGIGFGTKVVLQSNTLEINNLLNYLDENTIENTIYYSDVTDPTYPFWVDSEVVKYFNDEVVITEINKVIDGKLMTLCTRKETTCYYFFGDKEVIGKYFTNFELMK